MFCRGGGGGLVVLFICFGNGKPLWLNLITIYAVPRFYVSESEKLEDTALRRHIRDRTDSGLNGGECVLIQCITLMESVLSKGDVELV